MVIAQTSDIRVSSFEKIPNPANFLSDLDTLNLGIAWLQLREKQYDEALLSLERLSPTQQASLTATLLKARTYFDSGRNKKAIDVLTGGLQQYPNDGQLRLLYARTLMSAEKWELARAQLSIMATNADEKILLALGLLALEGGMTEEAIDLLKRATASPQYDDAANYYLGGTTSP